MALNFRIALGVVDGDDDYFSHADRMHTFGGHSVPFLGRCLDTAAAATQATSLLLDALTIEIAAMLAKWRQPVAKAKRV